MECFKQFHWILHKKLIKDFFTLILLNFAISPLLFSIEHKEVPPRSILSLCCVTHIGCSTNFTPLGCHSDVPITHGPNLTPLKSGSDAPIMYSLKFTSVVCHSNIPIRYSPDLTPKGMP